MVDVHSPDVRSKNMRAIRSKDTKPEILVRKALFAAGFRYRLHKAELPGKPDIVFQKYRTVIFIHGCFWHGHDCKYFKLPNTRQDFWCVKIKQNQDRDLVNIAQLNKLGWHVILVWECTTRPSGIGVSKIIGRISACLDSFNQTNPTSLTIVSN